MSPNINFNYKNEFCILKIDINSNSNETHANVVHGLCENALFERQRGTSIGTNMTIMVK
jgi:hypothetical protein